MGIFTSIQRHCPKCGAMAIWDGPFSSCGCYTPENMKNVKEPQLDQKCINEAERVSSNIKRQLRRNIDLLDVEN